MILSHEYKFIYIQTKKTAGTSITSALRPFLGKNDIIWDKPPGKHRTVKEIARSFPMEWKEYFNFTVVRHPLDRIVSEYYYSKDKWGFESIQDFIQHPHLQGTLNAPIITINKKIAVDNILKFEDLEKEWRLLLTAIGLDYVELPRENSTQRPPNTPPEKVLGDRDIKTIAEKCPFEKTVHEKLGYEWRL